MRMRMWMYEKARNILMICDIDVVVGNPARVLRKIEVKEMDPNLVKAGGS